MAQRLNGQEEYHGTLVGADGTPVPLYDEVAQLGREFEKAGPALSGTEPHSEVALLHSYDSRWAVNWQRHNQAFDPIDALLSYYGPLRALVHSRGYCLAFCAVELSTSWWWRLR